MNLLKYIRNQVDWENMGFKINSEKLGHLSFANDIVIMLDCVEEAATILSKFWNASQKVGLKINRSKAQYVTSYLVKL